MGKAVSRKIRENIIFSFVTKAIVVVLTLAGYSYLWAAIAVDVGSMLIVTLNGMTLLPSKGERKKNHLDYNTVIASEDIESNQIE
jgi:Cd2+/Zn2+-exporting ATPase